MVLSTLMATQAYGHPAIEGVKARLEEFQKLPPEDQAQIRARLRQKTPEVANAVDKAAGAQPPILRHFVGKPSQRRRLDFRALRLRLLPPLFWECRLAGRSRSRFTQMTVDIDRDLNASLAHLFLDVCWRDSGLNPERAERMADVRSRGFNCKCLHLGYNASLLFTHLLEVCASRFTSCIGYKANPTTLLLPDGMT
jgi:hypothetical protein